MTRWTSCTATSNSRCSTPTQPALGLDPGDERCFLPIHVYATATTRPVAVLLRPGKTPSGIEIRGHLRRLVRRIRKHWPATRITIRGDGHYGRPEVMEWCDENGINFIFGLPGNAVLNRLVDETADDIRTRRALDQKPCRGALPRRAPGEILEHRPPHLRSDRGHHPGPRYPLRRDQHRDRVGRAYLPDAL